MFKIFTYIITAITLIVFLAFLILMSGSNGNITTKLYNDAFGIMMALIILGAITAFSWEILTRHYGWSLNIIINKNSRIAKYLLPSFDELSIFIMSYSFFFLLVANDVFKSDLNKFLFHEFDLRSILMFVLICMGAVLSTYHLFTSRKKTRFEKWVMLFSVAILNVIIGFNAFFYFLDHLEKFSILFAVWNFVNGMLLLALVKGDAVNESAISDWNAPFYMAIVSIVIVSIIAITCQYYFRLYWAFSLSITIAYCTTINSFIIKVLQHFSKMKNYDSVS